MARSLLRPNLEDVDNKIQPGAAVLTWASMNIDGYLHHIHQVCLHMLVPLLLVTHMTNHMCIACSCRRSNTVMYSCMSRTQALLRVLCGGVLQRATPHVSSKAHAKRISEQQPFASDLHMWDVLQGLQRLEDLVHKVNDILDNRVEANLSSISKMRLVDLPVDRSFTYEEFVATQAKFVKKQSEVLAVK